MLLRLLGRIQEAYLENPYHNALHGADVLQTLHWIIIYGGVRDALGVEVLNDRLLFAAIIAALAHDVGHMGVSNNYLIKVGHNLAITYNDKSPLECMHSATLFQLMRLDGCNILEHSNINPAERTAMRSIIIDMILSTDMKNHAALLNSADTVLEEDTNVHGKAGMTGLLLELVMHASDISNGCSPTPVALQWATRIQEEFWAEGDKLKAMGEDVMQLLDRQSAEDDQNRISQTQIGFCLGLVKPLFSTLHKFDSVDVQLALRRLDNNIGFFRTCIREGHVPTMDLAEIWFSKNEVSGGGVTPCLRIFFF